MVIVPSSLSSESIVRVDRARSPVGAAPSCTRMGKLGLSWRASKWCLEESVFSTRSRTLRPQAPVSMSVPVEVEISASVSTWVSDLELRDVASVSAGTLSLGSGCESGLPKRTSMASPSTTVSSCRQHVACVIHRLKQSLLVTAMQRSRFLPNLRLLRALPLSFRPCDQTIHATAELRILWYT